MHKQAAAAGEVTVRGRHSSPPQARNAHLPRSLPTKSLQPSPIDAIIINYVRTSGRLRMGLGCLYTHQAYHAPGPHWSTYW